MEREFNIYGTYGELPETFASRIFLKEIQDRINNDADIISRAKSINQDLFAQIAEITAKPDNALYIGSMVLGLLNKTPRYSYIKHVEYNGSFYDVEIDLVKRSFSFRELED